MIATAGASADVAVGKDASADQRNAHRLKVVGADDARVRANRKRRLDRPVFDLEFQPRVETRERRRARHGDALDAGIGRSRSNSA